ncbi:NnrS family protein [Taklimakanibacter lacteus]|uniref:NnrS family protein n=1 Tax=Taklimakanibacter lacteus TaxID=2268456 RepID=UPI000E66D2B6
MAPVQRLRNYTGPAILSYGFRPFFLCGSLFAGIAILAWLPMFEGRLALPTTLAPRDWHIHEMLYGYLAAVMTGFLLTAIPNWTGRLPIRGRPLLALVLLWLAGRVAIAASAWLGTFLAAAIDVSFLLLVIAAAAREIITGASRHNLKILAVLAVFAAGNISFHVEAHGVGEAAYGTRLGIAAAIVLVSLVGGRVVPSFTRNWLVRVNPGRLPASFGKFDALCLALTAAALLLWTGMPDAASTGAALVAAGLMQAIRLARWAGDRTLRDRLVLILHVAYAFVPLGLLLVGVAALLPGFPPGAGIHAWTAGAIGTMTIAIMSRASLGHTGRALVASPVTQVIYGMIVGGGLLRICASLVPELAAMLIPVAGLAWAGAFLGFALHYWAILTGPRLNPVTR